MALALYRGVMNALSPAHILRCGAFAPTGQGRCCSPGFQNAAASPRARGPQGTLIWIHGASVGESLAVVPLVTALLEKPGRHVLVTTGTVTSAQLMAERLPPGAIHQYVPVDSVSSVRRFLAHWQPDLSLFVESELWPNLILETRRRGVPLALVNARLSAKSFGGWSYAPRLARRILSCFDTCLAQDGDIASRLIALGAHDVRISGSLKADTPPMPVDEAALLAALRAARSAARARCSSPQARIPAKTSLVLRAAAALLQAVGTHALTVIVPRHPERGPRSRSLALARGFRLSHVAQRRAPPSSATEIYIADTMGELGLFYRVAQFAFLGGSLVPHGGQNPLEAGAAGCRGSDGPAHRKFRGNLSARCSMRKARAALRSR